ncbi:MAG: YdcF family protein, partial [Rhodomicrobium sp.]|nr:YdcF family protein [Rhodomicrobium sp.]
MFYISKIVWGVFQPSSFIGILLFAGASLAALGRKRTGLRLALAGVVLYITFGFSPFSNWLLVPLELRAGGIAEKDMEGAAGIIVLGGAIGEGSAIGDGAPHLNESADRMIEAVRLAKRYPALPIIFSGGKAELIQGQDAPSEAELARRFFAEFQLAPPRLRLEDRARNTYENAVLTAKLLQPDPGQKWILVTSAFHMPRAIALFEGQGFRILPSPTDFRTNGTVDLWHIFPQPSDGLRRTDIAAKEWAGILVSWLRGDL